MDASTNLFQGRSGKLRSFTSIFRELHSAAELLKPNMCNAGTDASIFSKRAFASGRAATWMCAMHAVSGFLPRSIPCMLCKVASAYWCCLP